MMYFSSCLRNVNTVNYRSLLYITSTHSAANTNEMVQSKTSSVSQGGSEQTALAQFTHTVTSLTNIIVSPAISPEGEHSLSTNRTQGYLIALEYEQQLTAGLHGFSQLSKIAASLNLSSVEPFVQDTNIRGVPVIRGERTHPFWNLSMFYDLPHLQDILKSCSALTQLVSFETLMDISPHDIVYVYFLTYLTKEVGRYFSAENRSIVEVDYRDFLFHQVSTANSLDICARFFSNLQGRKRRPFTYGHARVVLVDARPFRRLSLRIVTEVLASIVHEEVAKSGSAVLVFDKWRGIRNREGSEYFYFMPEFVWDDSKCGIRTVQHSKMVIEAAHQFSQSLNRTRPVIGVHIRGERLLTDNKGSTSYYMHCLRQLKTLLQTLTGSSNTARQRISMFHDLGVYGSKSCTLRHCVKGRLGFLKQLMKLGFPVVFFDPAMSDSTSVGPAFASFVEKEYLAHVDVLVTVGRGGFQQSIVERFLKYAGHNEGNLHSICSSSPR